MFTVYEKLTNQEVKVYDVQRDKCGYPQFLICVGDNEWKYRSAKHYMTKKKRNKDTIKKVMCNHSFEKVCKRNDPPYFINEIKYRCAKCSYEYWE